jgi:hypothetical protein
MIRLLLLASLGAILPLTSPAAELSEPAFNARTRAIELAGAFSNDGYKLRDGFWSPTTPQPSNILEVFLFSGNLYWFSAATPGLGETPGLLQIELFDQDGQPVAGETYQDNGLFALGIAPTLTGTYFLRVSAPAETPFCLLYSYK